MRMLALITLLVLVSVPTAPAARATESEPRVGLLIVDHGEPPEYNERTYESFRDFFNHLIEMGLIPWWLKLVDTGTILQDENCYACPEPSSAPVFIDAWLDHREGPAVYVPASDSLPAHYVIPGGPGLGEPDIFEHVGLGAWNEWQLMGGRSPNYDQKLPKKRAVIAELRRDFPRLPVSVGYGIDPRLNGGSQGLRPAVADLINRDRVEHLVVAYHGVGFSDIMQTHMIRHRVEEIAGSIDPSVTLSYSQPIGVSDRYVRSIVEHVKDRVGEVPSGAPLAIHLSGHGLATDMCGDYNCGADAYHQWSASLFRRTRKAILSEVERAGKFEVFHLYGEGGEEEDDPGDEVDSPMEALAARKDAGYKYVIDIPYEFDSDSRDTLIVLRHGYERPIPDWDRNYVSRFRHDGMRVTIDHSHFGEHLKAAAFEEVIRAALSKAAASEHHDH